MKYEIKKENSKTTIYLTSTMFGWDTEFKPDEDHVSIDSTWWTIEEFILGVISILGICLGLMAFFI